MAQTRPLLCKFWQKKPENCPFGAPCSRMHLEAAREIPCHAWTMIGSCKVRDSVGCPYNHPVPPGLENTAAMEGLATAIPPVYIPVHTSGDPDVRMEIERYHDVASYSWVGTKRDMIAIPGMPKMLTPPRYPLQLEGDYVTPAPAGQTERVSYLYTFDPALLAMRAMVKELDVYSYDLVTDHSVLRRFIDILKGCMRNIVIDVEIHAYTVFFGKSQFEIDHRSDSRNSLGRGKNFTAACSSAVPDYEMMDTHMHLVHYQIGSVSTIVQFPVDVFGECDHEHDTISPGNMETLEILCPEMQNSTTKEPVHGEVANPQIVIDLVDEPHHVEPVDELRIVKVGAPIGHECMMQTRALDIRNNDTDYILADAWLTGVSRMYIGKYDRRTSTFSKKDVINEDWKDEMYMWELDNEDLLARFKRLIFAIIHEVWKARPGMERKTFALHYEAGDKEYLKMYARTDDKRLVSDALAREMWHS